MTTIAASFSLRMIRHQFIRKITEPLLPLLIRYTCFFLVIGVVLALASSVEAYASPVLMKEVVEAINKNKYFLRIIINLFYCFSFDRSPSSDIMV